MSSDDSALIPIRPYRSSDFQTLCAIDRECFSDQIAYSPEEMALGLIQPGSFSFVAEQDSRIVAFVLACTERRKLGHIITIDVLPAARRLGLGKRLMLLAEETLRERSVERVILEVSVLNEDAIHFYESLGYVNRRIIPQYYTDGTDAFLMEKSLKA